MGGKSPNFSKHIDRKAQIVRSTQALQSPSGITLAYIPRMRGISRAMQLSLLAGSIAFTAGCDGIINNQGDGEDLAEAPRFPRLTNDQWQQTVTDLLYLDEPLALTVALQADPPLGRFDNNIARLAFSAAHWRSFQRAAEEVASLASQDEAIVQALSPADLPSELAAQGEALVETLGPRAYRRPLSASEVEAYQAVFTDGANHYPDQPPYEAGLRLVLETMLQSPHFLYRVEDSTSDSGAVKLDGYEVANRLSFAFWNTMPSDELFAAAKSGELDNEAGVREWAETLFDDDRTSKQFRSFHVQAFEMAEYTDLDKNEELFPQWNREVGSAMLDESARFLEGEVFGGGGIREILTSNRTYVNADLAALYGLEGDYNEEFVPVDLNRSERSGILTRLGFLTRNATLSQSDPIHRGVFVNLNLLCRPLSAPPELPDVLDMVGDTNRERVDSVTGVGTCGEGCHATLINPIGFSLEHYDALGQYREEESGFPVDAADVYTFASGEQLVFNDALELSEQLAESTEVHACYIQQLLEYLLGRDLGAEDMALVEAYAVESVETGISVREIILRVVESRAFRYRVAQGGAL